MRMDMLSADDLKKIGEVVDERLDRKFDEKLEPVLEAVREGFEAVDRRFEDMDGKMATKDDLAMLGSELRGEMAVMRHELMDHTDRTVQKAVGNLRSELRERDVIA